MTNIAREEPIKRSPIAWSDLAELALPAITNNSVLTVGGVDTILQQWLAAYTTVSVDVMGSTVQSRQQKIVRLFDDGAKPILGISCGIHGNEVQSLRGWMSAVEWLLSSDNAIAIEARNSLAIYLVPLFNPDGTALNQRNNANNVNLNRNWPYFFSLAPDSDKGSAGLSEPETNNFATYMLNGGKVQRVIGWLDSHDWESQTTFGFLHEKIYHSQDTVRFARSAYNHINVLLKSRNYAAVNSPVVLREYMSTRKAYLTSWITNNGQAGCWSGIIEFPESESVSLTASVAQDCMVGLVLAALHQLGNSSASKIIESSTYSAATNQNGCLQNWSSTEPRPQYFSGSGIQFSQVLDSAIGRNVAELKRPDFVELSAAQGEAAYALVPQANGQAGLYVIGGRNAAGNRTDSVVFINTATRALSTIAVFPIAASHMAAATDGSSVYVSGGFTTGYVDAIYKSSGSGQAATFSIFLDSMSVYAAGVQRHAMSYWPGGGYLIISGGRDNVAYQTGVFAVDPATGYIWRIGNLLAARGWHCAAVSENFLHVFGGWTGAAVLSSVERLTLADNKVGSGADGAVSLANRFSSSQYAFSAVDVGRRLTIQQSGNKGEYTITAFVSTGIVTVSPSPAVNNTTGHAFVVSTAPPSASAVTALPAVRHRQALAQDGAIAYLFGGMPSSSTYSSTLYKYDMSANTVATVSYSMDEYIDEEAGVSVPLETPVLASCAGYYDATAQSVVVVGGLDDATPTSTARKDIYEIDLGDAICGIWSYELESYGFMRMTQVFTNQKAMLVAAVRNMTAKNNTKAPYVRLTVLIGPLGSPTRKLRTWHQVPTSDGYDMLMMPVQLEAGETEYRCYIRHYTAQTTIRVASFQLLAGEEKLTFPLPVSGIKQPDVYTSTLLAAVSFSESARFVIEGDMIPLVNTNVVVTEVPLISFYGISNELLFSLSYSSASDGSANYAATGKGTLKVSDAINGTFQAQTSFEINGNRMSGKEIRYDVISWKVEKTTSAASLRLSWYGEVIEFSLSSIPPAKQLKRIAVTNGIFSAISGSSLTTSIDYPDGVFRIPINSRGDNCVVELLNDTAHPCKFSSCEWVGLLTSQARSIQ